MRFIRFGTFLTTSCLLSALNLGVASGGGLPITTMSVASSPTTAPVAPVLVLLLPFKVVGPVGQNGWISEAIDEDLSHDLARNAAIHLVRPSTTQPIDSANGLAAAREAGADRLISGSYQVVDDQLRITAEVIDTRQTQPVGQVKATGHVRELFQLEDSLATQLWHTLPQPSQPSVATDFQVTPLEDYQPSAAPQTQYYAPTPEAQSAPEVYEPAPTYGGYDSGVVDSGYPYGYGYPYGLGFPLFIYGGYGRHDSFHHSGDGHVRSGYFAAGHSSIGHFASPASPRVTPTAPHTVSAPEGASGGAHFGGIGHR